MTFSDAGPDASSERRPGPLTGGAARQARYRATRQLRSIDVRAATVERIARLCIETSLNTQALLALALDCLEDRLHPDQAQSGSTRRPRPATEPSPVTPDLFAREMP